MTTTLQKPAADDRGDERNSRRPTPSWLLPAVAVVLAFAAGLGITRLLDGDLARGGNGLVLDGVEPVTSNDRDPVAVGEGAGTDVAAPADATSPEAAVRGFLAAEIAEDREASYAYLAAEDRATNRSPVFWTSRHAYIPPVVGFRITGTEEQRDGSIVVLTDLRLRSALDPVLGLVPARALGTWVAVPEGTSWRVAYERSDLEAQYPDEADALEAAVAWVRAQQACDVSVRIPLYGTPDLARKLCGAEGAIDPGQVRGLATDANVSGLVSAYGPEAQSWARVVSFRGPIEIGVVLAPVDDAWVVAAIVPGRGD